MWLLHLLFLDPINWELQEWAEMWNTHTMSLRGMRNQSPSELFFFGMVEKGVRGARLDEDVMTTSDLEEYGVDWADIYNVSTSRHHREHNPENGNENVGIVANAAAPSQYSRVDVPLVNTPLTVSQTEQLLSVVQQHGDLRVSSMTVRRVAWCSALQFCRDLATLYVEEAAVL